MSRALHGHIRSGPTALSISSPPVLRTSRSVTLARPPLTDQRRFGMIGRNSWMSAITAPMFPGPAIFRQCPDRYFPSILAVRFRGHHCWVRSTTALRPAAMLHRLKRPQLCSLRRAA